MKKLAKAERSRLAAIAWGLRKESRKLGSFVVPEHIKQAMKQQGITYRKHYEK